MWFVHGAWLAIRKVVNGHLDLPPLLSRFIWEYTAKATVIYACSNMEHLGNELTLLQEELDYWKRRSIGLESYSRRENIKIFNVQETADENTEAVVNKFLNENLKIPQNDVNKIRFERVHRLPTRQSNKPIPIIARFSFFQDKEFVWSLIKNLKGSNTTIADDYPKEIENIHKTISGI